MAEELWALTDHACAKCLGRVLRRVGPDGRPVVRCADCGTEAAGEAPAVCACGIRRGKYAGLRCIRQEAPAPGMLAEVVVAETTA